MVGSTPKYIISEDVIVALFKLKKTHNKNITLEAPPKSSEGRRVLRVLTDRWIVVFSFVIILVLLILAIFAPLIAPYNPIKQNLDEVLQQPSIHHLLGTDEIGRDVLSRIIYGTRISIMVGVIVTGIASVIGVSAGMIAGYFGGWTYNIIMRIIDAVMAIPMLILALAIGSALGGGLKNVMISVGIAMVPGYCRIMCAQVISLKENDYIMAERSIGAHDLRIMLKHILPNTFAPILVLISLNMGTAILAEAGLSFLGIGVSPPQPAWGSMVSTGYTYLTSNPILSIAPGLAIMWTVVAFNVVGDGLRDALDPKLRGTI
jgi:peptide/nickel transport system permease protein